MRIKKIGVVLTAVGIAGMVSASTISWSGASAPVEGTGGETLSTGLFNTTGTFVMAENVGTSSATTFDGITFAAGFIGFGGWAELYHDNSSVLSDAGTWGPNGSPSTVSLTGLASGTEYRIQALVYDGRSDNTDYPGRTVEFDGVDQGRYANGTSGNYGSGLLVTGTFTADAATQDFTIEAFKDSASRGGQLNALTVYSIPEPSSVGMIALLGGGILGIRRKLMM